MVCGGSLALHQVLRVKIHLGHSEKMAPRDPEGPLPVDVV